MAKADVLLDWLARGAHGAAPVRTVLAVAHPDDESASVGGHLAALKPAAVICVTDGAPRRRADAAELAKRRAAELESALACAGVSAGALRRLGVPDQEAIFRCAEIAHALRDALAALQPDVVLTHAYEGGHPDHDAVALAVHRAAAGSGAAPALVEFAGYNAGGVLRFLPGDAPALEVALTPARREAKARLLACHASQQEALAAFPRDVERFRAAPRYDFQAPPHGGKLHYEHYDWGVDGRTWRALARALLQGGAAA